MLWIPRKGPTIGSLPLLFSLVYKAKRTTIEMGTSTICRIQIRRAWIVAFRKMVTKEGGTSTREVMT